LLIIHLINLNLETTHMIKNTIRFIKNAIQFVAALTIFIVQIFVGMAAFIFLTIWMAWDFFVEFYENMKKT
jgi:hypothetical protein